MAKNIKRKQVEDGKAPKQKTVDQKKERSASLAGTGKGYEGSIPSSGTVADQAIPLLPTGATGSASDVPEENKNQRLEVRLTKLQKELISKASRATGFKNVSDYILFIAITDSRNVLREQQIVELTERDRISFMEALRNPPVPGKHLKKALANYRSFKKGE